MAQQYNGNSGPGGALSPSVTLDEAHANGLGALQRREAFSEKHPEVGIRMQWDDENRRRVCVVREPGMKPRTWVDFDAMMDDLEARYGS